MPSLNFSLPQLQLDIVSDKINMPSLDFSLPQLQLDIVSDKIIIENYTEYIINGGIGVNCEIKLSTVRSTFVYQTNTQLNPIKDNINVVKYCTLPVKDSNNVYSFNNIMPTIIMTDVINDIYRGTTVSPFIEPDMSQTIEYEMLQYISHHMEYSENQVNDAVNSFDKKYFDGFSITSEIKNIFHKNTFSTGLNEQINASFAVIFASNSVNIDMIGSDYSTDFPSNVSNEIIRKIFDSEPTRLDIIQDEIIIPTASLSGYKFFPLPLNVGDTFTTTLRISPNTNQVGISPTIIQSRLYQLKITIIPDN